MVDVAESYADLIKKMIEESEKDRFVDSNSMNEINKGIEALNRVASAIYTIESCYLFPRMNSQHRDKPLKHINFKRGFKNE